MLGSDGKVLFEQTYFHMDDIRIEKLHHIDNIIFNSESVAHNWIEESTKLIAKWRYRMRSTYARWCLCINGLCLAEKKYKSHEWKSPDKKFAIHSLRLNEAHILRKSVIANWDGTFTADASAETVPMLCAWALIDIYRCIEEFIFSLYRIYLSHHPIVLISGPEFREMRRLFRYRQNTPEDMENWNTAWDERLNRWQRRKIYDGLKNVFLSYCDHASLKQPYQYELTTPKDWAETIEGIALLRNSLTHGCKIVTKELADFSTKPYSMTFDFEENQQLDVELHHLMGVECFCDQILSALNMSIVETIIPSLK